MGISRFLLTILTVIVSFVAGVISVQIVAPELLSGRSQKMPEAVSARLTAAGNFVGMDSIRKAQGRAQLLDAGDLQLLRFTDFRVSNAPHLEVWLSKALAVDKGSDVRAADIVPVGPLRRASGDQAYLLPAGHDLADFRSVLIWSKEFGVLYGISALEG